MGIGRLLVALLAGSPILVHGLVIPDFGSQKTLEGPRPNPPLRVPSRAWDTPPSDDRPDNLIFFRLATLLQHWPNTRYPSGHSVTPGTVPIGTTLYHGRGGIQSPTVAEWLAFDPEHAILFTRRAADSRLFTFVTTRPLRILYFDGSSAAKLSSGSMDTQDLLVWGMTGNNTMGDERRRIVDLCEWGKDLGIDGYVRMEQSFEIMHCDFSENLQLVSSLHLIPTDGTGRGPRPGPGGPPDRKEPTPPLPPPPPYPSYASPVWPKSTPSLQTGGPRPPPRSEPRPPNWKGALPSGEQRGFEAFQAGSWHNRAPGEVRVQIDAARLVSLYDPALKSGVGIREGKEKVLHRGKGLSERDVSIWRQWIRDVVHEDAPVTSGVDWPALTTVIMDRYGARLEYLQSLLRPDRVSQNLTAAIQDVRSQLMLMLVTDITTDTVPSSGSLIISAAPARVSQIRRRESQDHTWIEPIAIHCSSFLVSHLPKGKFTREEETLYAAVSGTQAEICRVLVLLWSEAYDPSPASRPEILLQSWRTQVDDLMSWLDWPMWNRCRPECSLDTMCFIPTWPMGVGRGPWGGGEEDLSKVDWTPKCIPRGKWT